MSTAVKHIGIGTVLTTFKVVTLSGATNFERLAPDEHFIRSLAVVLLQLLGYYVSLAKGLDVDKPRNLAISVTVGENESKY